MAETLDGKIALITGASHRIGKAIALALADRGAGIVAHCRREGDAAELLGDLAAIGVRSWVVTADLQKPDDCEGLVERALVHGGSLDVLVNNASIFPASDLESMTFADVTQVAQVNAWAPFTLTRSFARQVGRGSVVNLLDTQIGGYNWGHVAYLLSKQMLYSLTRMCALAYAPGITVNGIAPGPILPPPGQGEEYLDRLAQTVPLKRHGEPDDIAGAVIYFVTNRFVTGEVLHVDGGRHLEFGGQVDHG